MDILFTDTPRGLSEEDYLRRYRAAKAVSEALGEPIQNFLRDWTPAHRHIYEDMDRRERDRGEKA